MVDSPLTPAARRHIGAFLRELAPHAGRLRRRFRTALRHEGLDPAQSRAFLAITPAAAGRGRLSQFTGQVQYNARRLAKLNVSLEQIGALLSAFDVMAGEALGGRFAPAREQLQMMTRHTAALAFYEVREAEAQALFGIARAEAEAVDLDDLLRRLLGVLTRTFRAREARLLTGQELQRKPRYVVDSDGSHWSYPMGEDAVLLLGFSTPYPWLPRERTLLDAVVARCREAIAKARDQRDLRRLEAEARAAEEAERRRIGRELHDETGQSLLLLRLKLEMLERDVPAVLRGRLAEARGIVEETVSEVRRIIAALSPAVLERLGLVRALEQLAARFRRNSGVRLRVRIAGSSQGLPPAVAEVIYRVAQEGLQNISKHSRAGNVNLSLQLADTVIRLRISDDGAGFCEATARRRPQSFGLEGMRERALLLGGTLAIRSAPARGTMVTLELPNGKDSSIAH